MFSIIIIMREVLLKTPFEQWDGFSGGDHKKSEDRLELTTLNVKV